MPASLLSLSWNELHPLLVHFPIALLLVAPLFVFLGALLPGSRGRTLLFSALVLMGLGTAGTFAARLSGEAAAKSASQSTAVHQVLENHEELAEITSVVFAVLTMAFTAVVWTIRKRHQACTPVLQRAIPLVFLVFYGTGIVLLVNTAEQGGRLTHEFGVNVKAPVKAGMSAAIPLNDADED